MDPLAHALFGAALAKTPLGRRSPMSAGALVVASIAPDLDAVAWLFGGREALLRVHGGLTHSPIGLVLLGFALVPFLRWVEREFGGRSSVFSAGGRPGTCAPAVVVGLLLHVPLDLLTDHGARPLLPFWGTWLRADLLHPTDPWLWLLFGGAAALAGRRSAGGSLLLALAALLGWGLVLTHDGPPRLRWGFPLACLLLAWLRAAEVGRKQAQRTLARAGGLGVLYLSLVTAMKFDSVERAREALAAAVPEAQVTGVHPSFGSPLAWRIVALHEGRTLEVRVRWGEAPEVVDLDQAPNHPLVQTAFKLDQSQAWLDWARHPVGTVQPEADGGAWVELRDVAEARRPWDEALRWRHRFSAEEVTRYQRLFDLEAELRRR